MSQTEYQHTIIPSFQPACGWSHLNITQEERLTNKEKASLNSETCSSVRESACRTNNPISWHVHSSGFTPPRCDTKRNRGVCLPSFLNSWSLEESYHGERRRCEEVTEDLWVGTREVYRRSSFVGDRVEVKMLLWLAGWSTSNNGDSVWLIRLPEKAHQAEPAFEFCSRTKTP